MLSLAQNVMNLAKGKTHEPNATSHLCDYDMSASFSSSLWGSNATHLFLPFSSPKENQHQQVSQKCVHIVFLSFSKSREDYRVTVLQALSHFCF